MRYNLPLSLGILSHAVSHGVDLFPALSPFMSISLLRAHVDNLQIIAPLRRVFLLVLHTVSFDGPFPRPFPLHHTPALIRCQHYDIFASSS